MKKIILGLFVLTSLSSFAATEKCSFETSINMREHQSFIGLIDDADEYVPARVEITTYTLKKESREIHSEKLKLKSLDNIISKYHLMKWATACATAAYNLRTKAIEDGCESKVLKDISDHLKCQY